MKNSILGDNPPVLDNIVNSLNPSSNPTSNSKAARKDSGTVVKVSCLLSWVDLPSAF
jgi:regulator of Ty1 transposition protein 103